MMWCHPRIEIPVPVPISETSERGTMAGTTPERWLEQTSNNDKT